MSTTRFNAIHFLAFQDEAYIHNATVLRDFAAAHVDDYTAMQDALYNVLGAINRMYHTQRWELVVALALSIRDTMNIRGVAADHIEVMSRGREAAHLCNDVPAEIEFLLVIGATKKLQGAWNEALTTFHEARMLGEGVSGAAVVSASALWEMANIYFERGHAHKARIQYLECLSVFTSHDDGRAGHVHNKLGTLETVQGHYDMATAHFDRALASWHQYGLERLEHTTFHGMGRLASRRGDFRQAHEYLELSLRQKREQGATSATCRTLYELGVNARRMRDIVAAEKYLAEALEVATSYNDRHCVAYASLQLAILSLTHARLLRSLAHASYAWRVLRSLGIGPLAAAVRARAAGRFSRLPGSRHLSPSSRRLTRRE